MLCKTWDKEGAEGGSRPWGVGSFTEKVASGQRPERGEKVSNMCKYLGEMHSRWKGQQLPNPGGRIPCKEPSATRVVEHGRDESRGTGCGEPVGALAHAALWATAKTPAFILGERGTKCELTYSNRIALLRGQAKGRTT